MTEPYHSETDSMALSGRSEFPEPKLRTIIPPHLKRSLASLNNIDLDDLCESQRLYELYEDAVERGWMPRGEAHMLFVFSAADHARHFRAVNPCGLFREIVQNNQRRLITDQEEDRARIRLREYLDQKRGLSAPKSEVEHVEPWVLSQASEDADTKQVAIFWEVLRQTGYKFYDEDHPFRLFKQTENGHEWTRSRWEEALSKLKKRVLSTKDLIVNSCKG